jgi:hypothetical protein
LDASSERSGAESLHCPTPHMKGVGVARFADYGRVASQPLTLKASDR